MELHGLRRADPQRFLEVIDEWLRQNANNFRPYSHGISYGAIWASRGAHSTIWTRSSTSLHRRGHSAARQGLPVARRERECLSRFSCGEAIDPKEWEAHAIPLLYQADSYAHVGDEASALDCCARLPDDH